MKNNTNRRGAPINLEELFVRQKVIEENVGEYTMNFLINSFGLKASRLYFVGKVLSFLEGSPHVQNSEESLEELEKFLGGSEGDQEPVGERILMKISSPQGKEGYLSIPDHLKKEFQIDRFFLFFAGIRKIRGEVEGDELLEQIRLLSWRKYSPREILNFQRLVYRELKERKEIIQMLEEGNFNFFKEKFTLYEGNISDCNSQIQLSSSEELGELLNILEIH